MRSLPSAALAPSHEYEDNGRKYWMRDARHRTGKRGIIHNRCISFKSCESVKAHGAPGRPAAFADALSRLNFARFTGCAIERDFSAGVREGEGVSSAGRREMRQKRSETGRESRTEDTAIKPMSISPWTERLFNREFRIHSRLRKRRLAALNPFDRFRTDPFPLAQRHVTINATFYTSPRRLTLTPFASLQMR